MPRILEKAIRIAMAGRGVSVVVIPGDVALQRCPGALAAPGAIALRPPIVVPGEQDLAELAALLNASQRTSLFCGRGCAGAHDALLSARRTLNAPIVHSRCAARSTSNTTIRTTSA